VKVMVAALVESRLPGRTLALMGPTEIGFDDAARLVAKVMGKERRFVHAPIAFHYLLARVAQATMTVPLIATAQVRILEEELVEPTLAPDAGLRTWPRQPPLTKSRSAPVSRGRVASL